MELVNLLLRSKGRNQVFGATASQSRPSALPSAVRPRRDRKRAVPSRSVHRVAVGRWLALVLVVAGAFHMEVSGVSAEVAEWDLEALMRARAEVGASRSTFEERRDIGLLSDPVHLQGRLVYRAPDYFRKTVTEPQEEELLVEGNRITITRDGHRDTLTLGDDPLLTGLVEAIRGTLAGDRAALERHFQAELTGAREGWRLRLRPKGAPLRERLERIVIRGSGEAIASVELLEANGDRSIMRIAHGQ